MMTFSFRPASGSTLPLMAASVRTRVVSWKDAADRKESVARAALVMPSRTCCTQPASDRSSPASMRFCRSALMIFTSDGCHDAPPIKSVEPESLMRHLAHI